MKDDLPPGLGVVEGRFTKLSALPLQRLYSVMSRLNPTNQAALNEARSWEKFIIGPGTKPHFAPTEYADQLAEFGLFQLPYEKMVVQLGPVVDDDQPERSKNYQDFYWIALIRQEGQHLYGRLFCSDAVTGPSQSRGSLMMPLDQPRVEWSKGTDPLHLILDEEAKRHDEQYTAELNNAEKAMFAICAFQCVGLCNSEGVRAAERPAPKFINKKREKAGKPPLFSYRVLEIDPNKIRLPGRVALGGSHASPRLHWRRGHIRRLADGRITKVRPCLVGDGALGRVVKDYAVAERRS